MNQLTAYTLRLGDNCLVLSQRLGEWCGHAPELEIDLALANIGLDLLGQARNFLSYAAELAGEGDEDTLAFTRDERQFSNLLLVEQPNGNFADTIARQYFIDAWHVALFTRLMESRDPQLAAISASMGPRCSVCSPFLPPVRYACSCGTFNVASLIPAKTSASHAARKVRGSTAIPSSLSAISISSASNSSAVKRHNLSMACCIFCPDTSVPLPSRSSQPRLKRR